MIRPPLGRDVARADPDAVAAVDLRDQDPHRLAQRRRQVLADVVGADRQLAVAAVDEDGELDGAGAAELAERVERGTDGAPGEEDVVDEHDDLVVDARRRGCR